MDNVWIKNYQKGVPTEIDLSIYSSLVDMFEQSCSKFSHKTAFSNLGTKISYADLEQKTKSFAAYLQKSLQLKKGDRVAIMMPNLLQYPVALYGILRAGMTVVNVNPLYTATELTHILNDSGAETIIILANFASVLQEALPKTKIKNVIVTEIGDLFPQPKGWLVNTVVKYVKKMVPNWHIANVINFKTALKIGHDLSYDRPTLQQEDVAFLQYTGGTTGVSKGTILTHKNLLANLLQMIAWLKPSMAAHQNEIIVTALPLYHIFSLTINCLSFTLLGGHNILITNPRDIPHFIKEIKKSKFTAISGVNTLFNALLNHPEFKTIDFSHLQISIAGGMALHRIVAEKWQKVTGCPMIEGYGLTESSPVVTANPLDIEQYTGSIGLPLPSTDISVRDDANNELGFNEAGELCVKGPQVMSGYWNNPTETASIFTADGWLRTGDIVKVNDAGYVFIVDRKKDMIIVSGFNVYPNEVEEVIAKCPGVQEVAVIGVSDQHSGEVVKAFIVRNDPTLTEEQIIEFCHQSLTRYKVPKQIEFRDELPKTNVGKILRRALREQEIAKRKVA